MSVEWGGRVKKCIYKNNNGEILDREFFGFYQYSEVLRPEPVVYGHKGGVRAYPLAIVMGNDGIRYIDPLDIKCIYEVEE